MNPEGFHEEGVLCSSMQWRGPVPGGTALRRLLRALAAVIGALAFGMYR